MLNKSAYNQPHEDQSISNTIGQAIQSLRD